MTIKHQAHKQGRTLCVALVAQWWGVRLQIWGFKSVSVSNPQWCFSEEFFPFSSSSSSELKPQKWIKNAEAKKREKNTEAENFHFCGVDSLKQAVLNLNYQRFFEFWEVAQNLTFIILPRSPG